MQHWCHGWPVEIREDHMPNSDGVAEVEKIPAEYLHCQVVLKPLRQEKRFPQPHIHVTIAALSDAGSLTQIDIFHFIFSCVETQTLLALAQLYSHAALAHDIFMPTIVFLSLDNERFDPERVYYHGFFDWLRRLIWGKDHKKKPTRAGERKPEQKGLSTWREGGREAREPRELDVWE